MKTADRLSQTLGAHISESMGAKRGAAASGAGEGGSPFPTGGVVHGGPGAEKYRGAARLKDAFAIELDRLATDPNQPRKEFDPEELERLAASLEARGQLQPVRVRYEAESNRWVIIAGERRYRAARLAGLTTLVCVEAKGTLTADDVLEDQLVENCVREDLKPIEQARAFKALLEKRGCSYRQLADALNISHQAVVRALALLELPADIQEKVDAGSVPASAASEVARIDDEGEQRALIARVESGVMTRDDVTRVVQSRTAKSGARKGKGRTSRPPVDDRPQRASNGVKVRIEATARHALADVVAALRELADRLEERLGQEAA
jgi:ParB family transcriptional regulator, chromosome partitioning protein